MTATTKITKIYDYILEKVKEAFPEHYELRDPEDITNNDTKFLVQGISILPGASENTEREISCGRHWVRRDFEVIFTRELLGTVDNVENRHDVTKAILEDLNGLLQAVGVQPSVFINSEQVAFDLRYVSDNGPRVIAANDLPFLFIEATFRVEYAETNTGGI